MERPGRAYRADRVQRPHPRLPPPHPLPGLRDLLFRALFHGPVRPSPLLSPRHTPAHRTTSPANRTLVFVFVFVFLLRIFLLGGYFHANRYRFGAYVWPSLLIWALDRFVRLARVVYYNHLYFGFGKKADRLDASVELLSPHFVRLHIQRPPHFSWTPGQTAFLTMPAVSGNPLESHPFTIASVDSHYQLTGTDANTNTSSAAAGDNEKKGSVAVAVDAARAADADDVTPYWKELTFLINVREGFTRRLAARAKVGEKVKVLVDGPYGFSPNLDNDDTVVLVAGGSGVTFTLSTFLGVLSHVQSGRSRCRRLVWVWSIREPGHIEWVSKALTKALELAPAELEISIRIYVTSKGSRSGSGSGGGNGKEADANALGEVREWKDDDSVHSSSEGTAVGRSRPPSLLSFDAVQVYEGRPELYALLREEVDATNGRISVTGASCSLDDSRCLQLTGFALHSVWLARYCAGVPQSAARAALHVAQGRPECRAPRRVVRVCVSFRFRACFPASASMSFHGLRAATMGSFPDTDTTLDDGLCIPPYLVSRG